MLETEVTVNTRHGLHARSAAEVVAATSTFSSRIRFAYDGREADGKSIVGLLVLAAPRGARLRLIVDGPDERDALRQVKRVLEARRA